MIMFDREVALKRLAGQTSLLIELLIVFETSLVEIRDQLLRTQGMKDLSTTEYDKIKFKIHTLKGSSGNLTFLKLHESAKRFEEQLVKSKGRPSDDVLKGFLVDIEIHIQAVRQEVQGLRR